MDKPPSNGTEAQRVAARVRAAIAYCGLRLDDVGQRSGVGAPKLRRITSASNPRGATPLEMWAIADACGVPRAWLELGEWSETGSGLPAPRPEQTYPFGAGDLEDRLEIIERYVYALLRLEEDRGQPLPDVSIDGARHARERHLPRPARARSPA